MRLVNVGAGEIADRLTILALKVAHGQQAGKDVEHFIKERNALLVQFKSAAPDGGMEQLFELAAVNAMLWYAEDRLRAHRNTGLERLRVEEQADVVTCAFSIQSLNDQRADLVWTLNKLAGTDLGREKL